MWTRTQLKDKAKTSLKRNYWKTVLVAIFALIVGGTSFGAASGAASRSSDQGSYVDVTHTQTLSQEEIDELVGELDEAHQQIFEEGADPAEVLEGLSPVVRESVEEALGEEAVTFVRDDGPRIPDAVVPILFGFVAAVVLIIFAVAMVASAFVLNPMLVGCSRFFAHNLNQASEVKEVAWGFDKNYRETVKTMFWRDIYTVLWGLLLVVPGLVKAYEYCMIPYLLADDPTLTKDEAFAQSKAMMDGNKWRAFVLDLSFLGWDLLGLLTLGIVSIFYVGPYKRMTKAALYEELRYGQPGGPRDDRALEASAQDELAAQVPVPPFAS